MHAPGCSSDRLVQLSCSESEEKRPVRMNLRSDPHAYLGLAFRDALSASSRDCPMKADVGMPDSRLQTFITVIRRIIILPIVHPAFTGCGRQRVTAPKDPESYVRTLNLHGLRFQGKFTASTPHALTEGLEQQDN